MEELRRIANYPQTMKLSEDEGGGVLDKRKDVPVQLLTVIQCGIYYSD